MKTDLLLQFYRPSKVVCAAVDSKAFDGKAIELCLPTALLFCRVLYMKSAWSEIAGEALFGVSVL